MLSVPKMMKLLEHTKQFRICTNNCGEQYLNPCNQLADNRVYQDDKIVSFHFHNGVIIQYNCVDQISMEENETQTGIILSIRILLDDPYESTIQKLVIPKYTLDGLGVQVVVDCKIVGSAEYIMGKKEDIV